jgi:mono/diheme cytochrome c family protein
MPAANATVSIEDISGAFGTTQTNSAGNFYITVQQWQPKYPLQPQVALGSMSQQMQTHIGRDGSCADCHGPTASSTSIGPIYITPKM